MALRSAKAKNAKTRHRDERAFCALLRSERVGLGELYDQLSRYFM